MKALYKELLIAEIYRLRAVISEKDKEIQALKDKLDPLGAELREASKKMSHDLAYRMYGSGSLAGMVTPDGIKK